MKKGQISYLIFRTFFLFCDLCMFDNTYICYCTDILGSTIVSHVVDFKNFKNSLRCALGKIYCKTTAFDLVGV